MSAYQTYYKCDRCGKTTFDNPYLFKNYIEGDYILSEITKSFNDDCYSDNPIPHIYISNLHLCEDCQNKFNYLAEKFMEAASIIDESLDKEEINDEI